MFVSYSLKSLQTTLCLENKVDDVKNSISTGKLDGGQILFMGLLSRGG